mmetsp:Transcript_7328/g.16232  ORF Transcript_7328/g.16232 Transcript_7328/m.16232 type:complete len:158 (+) Transcript_7328:3-476(+)
MWREGCIRTNPVEVADLLRCGQLLLCMDGDEVAGCVRCEIDPKFTGVAHIGMLCVRRSCGKQGFGRRLLDFAVDTAHSAGCTEVDLEILQPRDWIHETKSWLATWYSSVGFEFTGESRELVDPGLTSPSVFRHMRKKLTLQEGVTPATELTIHVQTR